MKVPLKYADLDRWAEKIAQAVNINDDGRIGTFTLTASTTTTTVTENRVGINTVIVWQPTTANAAGEMATMYESSRSAGVSFTMTHANAGTTDRTFKYILVG